MIKQLSLEEFLAQLASRSSTPGGGSAAALMGAMGAALVAMVCNLTVGKSTDPALEAELAALLGAAQETRAGLTAAIAQDIAAFDAVMAAYGLPKATPAEKTTRTAAIQLALRRATEVPMDCARLAARVIELSGRAATHGNLNVISDAGVAVMAAYASLKSAALNVYINTGVLHDAAFVAASLSELEQLLETAEAAVVAIYAAVRAKL